MPDWTSKLPTLDTSRLGVVDVGALAQPWDGKLETEIGDGRSDVTPGKGYRSPRLRRQIKDLRAINKEAMRHLMKLPGPGQSYHFLVGDRLGLWDIIPALLERIAPRPIKELWVSTLSYGSATAAAILDLLDEGRIRRIHFLVSVMFSAKNRHIFDELVPQLHRRGHRAAAMRTHAKILAIDLGNRERYVVESSSNLRTCHCAEQVTIIRDEGLYKFHRGWMDNAFATGAGTLAAAGTGKVK